MHSSRKQVFLAATAAALFACANSEKPAAVARIDTLHPGLIQVTSDQPTGWSDSTQAWKYQTTLTIQPDEGTPGELMEPGTIGVDDWGRIYLADKKPAVIKVFDSTGAFIRTIGREGAGPGEFKIGFIAVRGSHLVVHDPMQSRTSVFDTSGTFQHSWNSSCCFWDNIIIDSSDIVLIPAMYVADSGTRSRGIAYRRYRLDGALIDTVFVPLREGQEKTWTFTSGSGGPNRAMMMTNVPYSPSVVRTLHPDGGFVVGWTGEFRILRSPMGEDTTMIFTRSWTPEPIPESMRKKEVENMVANAKDMMGEAKARETAKLSDVPTTAPAYQTLRVDLDGNVWARQLIGSDSTRTRYDVFAPAGAWLGTVTLPIPVPEYGGQFFGHKVIYGVGEDADGRPKVVRVSRVN